MPGIKEHIKNGTIQGAYLIYGEEDYLKDYYTDRLVELCTTEGPVEFNCMKINGEKPDNDAVAEFIVSMPFMADKKILVIRNSGLLAKGAGDSVKKFWTETLDTLPEYMVIVFCETNVDKRGAIYKALSTKHTAEEFPQCKENELIKWFANTLSKYGKSMTKDDISFVIENVGRNMYLLKNEAEKLVSFTEGKGELISREDVEACICKSLEGRVFDLVDNITDGNRSKVISGLKDLKTLREQPVMIISLIFRQFSILRRVKAMKDLPISELARDIKVPDFVIRKNISTAKKFTGEELDKAIFACARADESIKSGQCEAWLALEQLAISLMTNKD